MTLPLFNIGGLMSGLDTNSIIDGLIDAERIPINQLRARRSQFSAKDTAWQEVATRFSAIRTALNAIDSTSDLDGFVTATSSNDAVLSASATGTAAVGSVTLTVDRLATTHRVASTTAFTDASDLVGAGDFTVTIGGTDHTVTADASTTLSDLAGLINGLDAGVTATVVNLDGASSKLLISSDESGAEAAFSTSSTIATLSSTDVVEQGVDAQVTIGSGAGALVLERGSNTITDLVDGVTITLADVSATPVTITVDRDTDSTVDAVTALMDEINTTLGKLGTLTAYNADAATGGALVGDSTARGLMIDLRSALSGTVNTGASEFAVASSIGISLTSTGTLEIDADALRDALETNHDEAIDLVSALAGALDSVLDDAEGSTGRITRARNTWTAQMDLIDDRIEVMEDRLERREAALLRQFTGLETAMATLTSQASWLTSQIAALNGGGQS